MYNRGFQIVSCIQITAFKCLQFHLLFYREFRGHFTAAGMCSVSWQRTFHPGVWWPTQSLEAELCS